MLAVIIKTKIIIFGSFITRSRSNTSHFGMKPTNGGMLAKDKIKRKKLSFFLWDEKIFHKLE